jgi:butyryl-CoA dehydrogenase
VDFISANQIRRKRNAAPAINIDAHGLCMNAILYCGTEEQKQKYLVPGAQGDMIGAAAVTDPAGSSTSLSGQLLLRKKAIIIS